MRKLSGWPGGANVRSVKINLVTWSVCRCWKLLLVVVSSHIILSLVQSQLGFLQCHFHLVCELVYCFHPGWLLQFEAHLQVLPRVEKERDLLRRQMVVIVVLEFCHWQKVYPVALSFASEQLEILLKFLVHSFHLAVCPWMMCSSLCSFDSQ